jgi:hypothetical protein
MPHNALLLLSPLIVMLLLSCGASRRSEGEARVETSPARAEVALPRRMAPGKGRVVGTIVSVESAGARYDSSSPCRLAPCVGVVRVDSIVGLGAGFPILSPGMNLNTEFVFTLGPTKDIFPDLRPAYPGLPVGSSFEADLRYRPDLRESGIEFIVDDYRVHR